ncbi:MAG: nucleolar zinc-finger protein [Candelina mexicana]|nr:MAG: nucleolar zinc-finger protein [Candelina mexicana]
MEHSTSESVHPQSESPLNSGTAHMDSFEDIGKKVEKISISQMDFDRREGTPSPPGNNDAIDEDQQQIVDEIESLCMNCHGNGTTRLLLTKIPFFREIILMSFDCPHCRLQNTEIQSAGEIQQRGTRYTFKLDRNDDFERQLVKSDTCIFRIEDLDLEIPAGRGLLTNVEGILVMVLKDLEEKQPERKRAFPELYTSIDQIVQKLIKMMNGCSFPFRISLDDPAGNSSIEPSPSDSGAKYIRVDYARTAEQNATLSLGYADEETAENATPGASAHVVPKLQEDKGEGLEDAEIVEGEVYTFPSTCPGCTKPCSTHMKMMDIPHFKQVVIMSTNCDHCGYRTNEVKTGGEVPERGRCITLDVKETADLSRDILKSESCAFACPELGLDIQPGTLGGRFTTVEGLLIQVGDDLHAKVFDTISKDAAGGDSMAVERKEKWFDFFTNLELATKGGMQFTVVLRDPLASSYVQSLCAPDPDPQIKIEDYERTEEEEEDLGLKDIKTEGYAEDHAKDVAAIANVDNVLQIAEGAADDPLGSNGGA